MPDCLFCKIAAGEVPATRVYEDERTIAFMDINPATRGHLLVIPREHAEHREDRHGTTSHSAPSSSAAAAISSRSPGSGCQGRRSGSFA